MSEQGQQYEDVVIEEVVVDDDASSAGCQRLGLGLLGCTGVLAIAVLIVVGGTIAVGATSINNLVGGVQQIFNIETETDFSGVFIPVVERINRLQELTTVRFNYANIVTSERELPGVLNALYGDRQVMVAVGHIEAGVDLSSLTQDDITVTDGVMTIQLPAPAIQDCFLNENESYVVSRDTGVFAAAAPELDGETRRFALQQFRAQAMEDDILAEAQSETALVVQEFIQLFIGDEVTVQVEVAAPRADAPLPGSCP